MVKQFKVKLLYYSIDRTRTGSTNLGQSGPRSNGKEVVPHIPHSSRTVASPSNSLESYVGLLLRESYPSAQMQSVNSSGPPTWAGDLRICSFYSSSLSSSCHAISTDIPDPFSPPFPIVHCFRQVFRVTSRISTELLNVGSSWSSCLRLSIWRGPQECITYEFVLTSPAVSGSSNLDSSREAV